MQADLTEFFTVGTLAALLGAAAVTALLRGDFAADAKKPGAAGARLFLGGALGVGVAAFSVKLAVAALLTALPPQAPPRMATRPDGAPGAALDAFPPAAPLRPATWRTLPAVAPAPAGNPTTPEKVALGRRLFHDPALSRDGRVSCASCHDVAGGHGGDGRPTALGVGGADGARNTPSVWNVGFQAMLFWDGRAALLERQALGPLLNPREMAMPSAEAAAEAVRADPTYRREFDAAFGRGAPITTELIVNALAAYQRTLISADAPYDRFIKGDEDALTPQQKRGMRLFQSVGCVMCHGGPNFSGASVFAPRSPLRPFPAIASPVAAEPLFRRFPLDADKGAARPTAAAGLWRPPSLRNVALTGPYFHNGAVGDLRAAVRIMAESQLNAVVSDRAGAGREEAWTGAEHGFAVSQRRVLSEGDVDDIVAFLGALSGDAATAAVIGAARHDYCRRPDGSERCGI